MLDCLQSDRMRHAHTFQSICNKSVVRVKVKRLGTFISWCSIHRSIDKEIRKCNSVKVLRFDKFVMKKIHLKEF